MERMTQIEVTESTLAAWGVPIDAGRGVAPVDTSFDQEAWDAQFAADVAAGRFARSRGSWLEDAPGWDSIPDLDAAPDFGPDPEPGLEAATEPSLPDGVGRVVAVRAEMARLQAVELRELADLAAAARAVVPADAAAAEQELAFRSLLADLAVTARVSERTMAIRMTEAETLVTKFPATLQALGAGRIGMGHVHTIVDCGAALTDARARARYEELVLARAEALTPARLRCSAELIATRVGKVSFQERHELAKAKRGVFLSDLGDGMSQLVHVLPTVLAAAAWDRLTQQAKAIKQAAAKSDGDPRSFDQIRADLAAELLLCGEASGDPEAPHTAGIGIKAEVAVVIPVLTLLGSDTDPKLEPATLTGKGPIDAATAKKLAAGAPQLQRILTDPITGMVLAVDTYKPSKKVRKYIRARDGRCKFPGCNRPARRCDIDHTVDWAHGGKTHPDNLACLCRGHHLLKHHGGWSVRQSAPGVLEWTSPTGRITTGLPESTPAFSAA